MESLSKAATDSKSDAVMTGESQAFSKQINKRSKQKQRSLGKRKRENLYKEDIKRFTIKNKSEIVGDDYYDNPHTYEIPISVCMQDGKIRDVFFIKFYPKKQEKHILLLANHTSDIKFKFSRFSTMKEVMITKYLCRLNYNEDKAEDIEDFTEKYKILDLDDFDNPDYANAIVKDSKPRFEHSTDKFLATHQADEITRKVQDFMERRDTEQERLKVHIFVSDLNEKELYILAFRTHPILGRFMSAKASVYLVENEDYTIENYCQTCIADNNYSNKFDESYNKKVNENNDLFIKLENQVEIFKTNNYTIPKLKKELEKKQAKLKKENQKVEMLKEAIAKAQQSLKHRSIKINKDKLERDLIQEAYKKLEADYEKLKKEKQELIKAKKLSDKTLRLQIASLIKKNSIIKKLDQDIAEIEAEGPTKGPKLDIYDETYDSYVPSPNVQCMVCVGLNRPIIGKRTYTTCCEEFLELCEICFRASIAIFKDKCCPYCKRSYDKMRGQELFLEPTYWRSDQS
ncbi:unnamed protein product [Moneuplotes crassus]|uniref:Uncharacterized protein n=1 Tax=Euplotes crassus TaxID=5936 RepID=A0AAD1YAD9_EUPCR|nr:unnamed protein product [Moneuplotes crassus]